MRKLLERRSRQLQLANLFYEMGMDIDLVEKISGVKKENLAFYKDDKYLDVPLTFLDNDSTIYLEK